MKIKVNGNPVFVKPISRLTFNEYNMIMIKGECTDLKSYLRLFCDMPIDEFNRAKLKGAALHVIAEKVFDINESQVIKDKKNTVKIGEEVHLMSDILINTVGQQFLYGLVMNRLKDEEINHYEFSLWCLAIALLKGDDVANMGKAEQNYIDLCGQQWTKVLPQAFFLLKRIVKPRITMWKLSILFMLGLKRINIMTRISKRQLIRQAEKALSSSFARFLTRMKVKFSG